MYPKNRTWIWSLVSLFVIIGAMGLLIYSFRSLDYEWDFNFLKEYVWQSGRPGLILEGLWVTIKISFFSILWGVLGGLLVGLLMIGKEPLARGSALLFVDIFRNTPVLVQLYVVYFIVGTAFELSPEAAGIMTLSMFCTAYVAEIFRGCVLEFEPGQLDAAKAMGLHPLQIAYYVMAPQILRRMLPALVGQFVSLVKDSSLVSIIAVTDLTKSALNIVSVSFKSFETWFVIALIYFLINLILSSFGRYLERRLRVNA